MLRQLLHGLTRAIALRLLSPPVVGAAYVLALAAYAACGSGGLDADGTSVAHRFAGEIVRMRVAVAATAISLGLVIGLFAELLVRMRHPPSSLARRSRGHVFVEAVAVVIGLHSMLVMWGMADTPQLYAARWYAQGGVSRLIQILATDWFGPRGIIVLALVAMFAYVRPARVVYFVQRALGAIRTRLASSPRGSLSTFALVIGLGVVGRQANRTDVPSAAPAPSTTGASGKPMSVLVLAASALRNDRLDAKRAPNLTRLGARGTRFDRAYVSSPGTFSSWTTILTGRHGHHHGIRSMFPTWEERAKDFDAVPGRFAKAGYATTVVSDYAGDVFRRIDLGFSSVEAPSLSLRHVLRQEVLERETPLLPVLHSRLGRKLFPAMRDLGVAADPNLLAEDVESTLEHLKKQPFFLTVVFSTAHSPYAAPAPYYRKFTDRSYRGQFKYHEARVRCTRDELPPEGDDVRQAQALYDGAVSAIDDAAGRVLLKLERLGLSDSTIVVVTADHGENLFDGGHGQGHGEHLFGDESTHVPLLIVDPRVAGGGRREGSIVRDVDLAPTLYELAGVAAPSSLDGRSLVPALASGASNLEPRFAYAETELWLNEESSGLSPELRVPYPGLMGLTELDSRHDAEVVLKKGMAAPTLMARHRMVRDERYKLVYVPTRLGVRYMLYDTENDPAEIHDVAASMPNEVARLRSELWAWMLEDPQMEQREGYLVPREVSLARGRK